MKIVITSTLFLALSSPLFGQKLTKVFYDTDNNVTDSASSVFYRVGKASPSFGTIGYLFSDTVMVYYSHSGKRKAKEVYEDHRLNGAYISWFEDGPVFKKGYYRLGRPVVYSSRNYPSGKPQETKKYVKEEKENFKELLVNYWDSTGKPLVTNGMGVCDCFSESKEIVYRAKGKVTDGIEDSVWLRFENNILTNKEKYSKGQLIEGVRYDGDQLIPYTKISEEPEFPGGVDAMAQFIQHNLKYPNQAKRMGQQGKVHVQFLVEADGSVKEARCIVGIGKECDDEACRVVSIMPKWTPGRSHGKLVTVKYAMPINFRLTQ